MVIKRYILWMAWRNLVSPKKRSGLSFMTVISILGVSFGVAALIIVLSVMGGFEADLKDRMLRGSPHLEVTSKVAGAGFSLNRFPLATFAKEIPALTGIEPFTQADVVLKQKRYQGTAVLFGIDPLREGHLWGFSGTVVEGEMKGLNELHAGRFAAQSDDGQESRYPGILMGEQLAMQLGADIGDEVAVLNPSVGLSAILGSGGTVMRTYVLVGKFRTGIFNYDSKWAVVSLAEGRKFMPEYDPSLDTDNYVSGVGVNIADPFRALEIAKGLALKLDEQLRILTWQEANKAMLFALKLEKVTMGAILMLVILVAGFSISGTLMMTVYYKRAQVSLMRALGMKRSDIASLFFSHGFAIGTVGIVFGLMVGIGICSVIRFFPMIPLPAGVYYLKSLPVKYLPFEYAVIALSAWTFSLLAAVYPAVSAARQLPSAGLR